MSAATRPGWLRTRAGLALALLALGLSAALAGCGHDRLRTALLENQRPIVRLTQAPAATSTPIYYAYELEWAGYDPDGTVDHYVYCVDPPTTLCTDTPWVATTITRQTFEFRSGDPDSAGTHARPGAFHVFVVKAVDDRGAESEPVEASFFTFTVAPTVKFLQPLRTSALVDPELPPTTTFVWTGTDPDGIHTRFPVSYKYHLFTRTAPEFSWLTLQLNPDSLRVAYAPEFAGWDSVRGDTCRVTFEGMTPGTEAVLVVVAFDEAGAYSPVFSYTGNLLRFFCSYAGMSGPKISVWNEYFSYSYSTPSYSLDPGTFLHLEIPGGRTLSFNWSATPHTGASILGSRWAMDLATIDDPAPRTDENKDWAHWSRLSSTTTQATVGPFVGTTPESLEQHTFYIETEDTNHLRSLAVIVFRVLRRSTARSLLFVDDTRLTPDRSNNVIPDSVQAPGGAWPTAAELDTFLFAIGGVHWRSYVPASVKSTPGLFAGYDFDTLGTRGLRETTLPLSVLAGYRCVVWYTDPAVDFTYTVDHPRYPMPMMRSMSMAGRYNSITAFAEMGGGLWLMGGGIAYNSLLPWNVLSNDASYRWANRDGMVFANTTGELVPGRMLFHTAHWQSTIKCNQPARAVRNPALLTRAGDVDWSALPVDLREKSPSTDPMPPLRSISSQFYQVRYYGEELTQPNVIPDLDTLYYAYGGDATYTSATVMPIMTRYHGTDGGHTVFSGFPLWYFQRAQAIQLVDFVLQRLWNLPRREVAR